MTDAATVVRVKVFLDDARQEPDGWTRTYTARETIELLKTGEVTHLSLDHDLGVRPEGADDTGYAVLAFLEQEIGNGRWASARDHGAFGQPTGARPNLAGDRFNPEVVRATSRTPITGSMVTCGPGSSSPEASSRLVLGS
jgi:hypothetical protein